MRRLYFRIYLTVLGSLLVFGILAGLAFAVLRNIDDEDEPARWFGVGSQVIAEKLFPRGSSPAALQSELDFWHERTGFSLMMLSPEGRTIAEAGEFPRDAIRRLRRRDEGQTVWRGRRGILGITLQDGRRLIALPHRRGYAALRHFGWLAALLGIGLAVGIATFPLVRHLTRKLERLQQGVAAFGAGDLSARVAVSGRDEIARLAETFNASAARIEQLVNAHKTLLANASHELRSPLARLRMASESTAGGAGAEAAQVEIQRNIRELDALVEEILLASRLQADAVYEMKLERVDLVGLLAEECAPFGADLGVSGTIPTLSADARLLRRLFRNLLENAERYGGGEPPAVDVSVEGKSVQISVCDRGPGVPADEREKIFEPFYRLKQASESTGGVGLGLALVKQIAERHGGNVVCLPRPGGGTCFRVALPVQGA